MDRNAGLANLFPRLMRSRAQTRPVVFLLCAVLCLGGVSRDSRAQAKKQSAKETSKPSLPKLCGSLQEVRVIVDLNSTSASTQLEFCPPNDKETAQATLTAGDFVSRMTKLGLGANVTFSRLGEKTGSSTFTLSPVRPGRTTPVKVEISNLWEAGEAEAPLRVNGVTVGKLVAVKYRLPFGVKVEAPDPAKPEITLEKEQARDVVLKNDDAVTYRIEWDFQVAGTRFPGNSGDNVVTPNSTVRFTVRPDPSWYTWLTGLLKDYDQDGKLTLSFRPPEVESPSYWPSKVISVKVHLRYCSETCRAWWANVFLLLVLVAGAMFSFLGSVGLPNRLKRSEYRENLARLGQRIGGISHQVDSRLRVVVRVQRKRLSDLLESRTNISGDLNRVFNQVSVGMAALEKQVHLAEQIDAAHNRLKLLDVRGAGPSLLTAAEETVWNAAEMICHIGPTDQELDQSQKHLDEAAALMDKAAGFDAAFAQELLTRSAQLQAELKLYVHTELYKKIHAALPGVFADLIVTAAPTGTGESSRLDRSLTKLELIRKFLQIFHVTDNPQLRAGLEKQLERLLAALSLESWEAVRTAGLVVRQMQEGIYASDLVQAGHAGAAHIEIDPNVARSNDVIRFNMDFGDPRLNTAAARQEFEGRWEFGHDEYGETGWEPFHYFPQAGSFPVTFKFQGDGDKQPVVVERSIKVWEEKERWYERDRNRVEIGRFAIALLPATFGLLAGAREQLLKMDVSSALFAVFLLGYGSDSVKNLVSQSQQTSAASPTAPAGGPGAAAGAGATPKPAAGRM